VDTNIYVQVIILGIVAGVLFAILSGLFSYLSRFKSVRSYMGRRQHYKLWVKALGGKLKKKRKKQR
jgi:hypothetical protein